MKVRSFVNTGIEKFCNNSFCSTEDAKNQYFEKLFIFYEFTCNLMGKEFKNSYIRYLCFTQFVKNLKIP